MIRHRVTLFYKENDPSQLSIYNTLNEVSSMNSHNALFQARDISENTHNQALAQQLNIIQTPVIVFSEITNQEDLVITRIINDFTVEEIVDVLYAVINGEYVDGGTGTDGSGTNESWFPIDFGDGGGIWDLNIADLLGYVPTWAWVIGGAILLSRR